MCDVSSLDHLLELACLDQVRSHLSHKCRFPGIHFGRFFYLTCIRPLNPDMVYEVFPRQTTFTLLTDNFLAINNHQLD